MSQENVEIVRSLWQAFERLEVPDAAFAEDAEWHTAVDLPDRETCRGVTEIQQMLAAGWDHVTDPSLAADEFADAGDQVAVRWGGWGTARVSGLPIEWHEAHVYALSDGKVVLVHEYRTWDQALKAVGLEE